MESDYRLELWHGRDLMIVIEESDMWKGAVVTPFKVAHWNFPASTMGLLSEDSRCPGVRRMAPYRSKRCRCDNLMSLLHSWLHL
jgi:hypothetical protein